MVAFMLSPSGKRRSETGTEVRAQRLPPPGARGDAGVEVKSKLRADSGTLLLTFLKPLTDSVSL